MRAKFLSMMVVFGLLFSFGGAVQGQGSACGALEDIAESVVLIIRLDSEGSVTGSGTGVIVDPSGLIYTNRHVVEGGAYFAIAILDNMNRPPEVTYLASLIGATEPIGNVNGAYADFAILQISGEFVAVNREGETQITSRAVIPGSLNLPAISPSLDEAVGRGDTICVFGFPETTTLDGQPTLNITGGAVTSILDGEGDFADQPIYYYTDAVIASGNSGGLAIKIGTDGEIHYIGIPTLLVNSTSNPGGELGVLLPITTQLALAETLPLITRFDDAEQNGGEPQACPFRAPLPVVFEIPPSSAEASVPSSLIFADGSCNPPVRIAEVAYIPSASPDGTRIAHGGWDGDSDIYIRDFQGNLLQHFDLPGDQYAATWSRDGGQIVFNSYENNEDLELWIMSANGDGSDRRQLTTTTSSEFVYPSAFSPDGAYLYYEACDPCDVMRLTLATGAIDNLTQDHAGFDGRVSVSPDGSKLVFVSDRNNQWDIYLMDIASGNVTQLTNDGVYEERATWIDDTTILFNSARTPDGMFRLYAMDINTREVQLFLDYPGAWRGVVVPR